MASILLSLPEMCNAYKSWVSNNPQTASDYETTAKWISYFIAGRINNSYVVSELLYCLSNLLVLFNDNIIRKKIKFKANAYVDKIKLWLTVVEYSEVFCELSMQKIWGNKGKWFIIVVIQIFKCVAKLLLLYKHKESVIEIPLIPPLERTKLDQDGNTNSTTLDQSKLHCISFTLKSSGRSIRKIESSPPIGLRSWKPLDKNQNFQIADNEQSINGSLLKRQLIAETIHITKPIIHLIFMGMFGTKAWKPWMISLLMDVASLRIYKFTQQISSSGLTKKQKLQLSRRMVLLTLYLIRSPFYEKYSENKINTFLTALSNNVPLVKIICNPLMQYLPFWQSNYFYMWS